MCIAKEKVPPNLIGKSGTISQARKKTDSIDLGSSKAPSPGLCTRCFQNVGHSDVAHSSITSLGHGQSILVEALLGVFPKSGKSISLGVLGVSLRVLFDEPFSGNHDWY